MQKVKTWGLRIGLGLLGLLLILFIILWISFYFDKKEAIAALPGNSQVVETAQGPIEYLQQGNSEQHILLLHGTPGSYRTFNSSILMEKGYRILSPSRPGYFRTPLSVGESLPRQADAYAALLDALRIDSVAVIGFSGGGPSAIEFALRHPDRCTHLVLVAAGMERMEGEIPAIQKLFSTEFGSWLATNLMPGPFTDPALKEEAKEYLQAMMLPKTQIESGRENDMRLFMSMPAFPLEQLQPPTLIMHGTADPTIPYAQAERAAARIPNAELLPMEEKDHFQVVFYEFEESLAKAADFINTGH